MQSTNFRSKYPSLPTGQVASKDAGKTIEKKTKKGRGAVVEKPLKQQSVKGSDSDLTGTWKRISFFFPLVAKDRNGALNQEHAGKFMPSGSNFYHLSPYRLQLAAAS